ncbi:MAG: nuclear transport factor 2 family protein, partial [Pseudomonadota bacterium]|nr:nuclear transport factor 2 family protein [Pseudomonadota bacterium]
MPAAFARSVLRIFAIAVLAFSANVSLAASDEQALERFLIQELQSRYALAHDLTDPDLYAAVFTEDAELYGVGRLLAKGREALHAIGVNDRKRFNAGAADGERSFGALRHVITNSVIDLTGDTTATGTCYVMTVVVRPGGGPEILSLGRYEDEYRKVDGEWLIAKR